MVFSACKWELHRGGAWEAGAGERGQVLGRLFSACPYRALHRVNPRSAFIECLLYPKDACLADTPKLTDTPPLKDPQGRESPEGCGVWLGSGGTCFSQRWLVPPGGRVTSFRPVTLVTPSENKLLIFSRPPHSSRIYFYPSDSIYTRVPVPLSTANMPSHGTPPPPLDPGWSACRDLGCALRDTHGQDAVLGPREFLRLTDRRATEDGGPRQESKADPAGPGGGKREVRCPGKLLVQQAQNKAAREAAEGGQVVADGSRRSMMGPGRHGWGGGGGGCSGAFSSIIFPPPCEKGLQELEPHPMVF